MLAKRIIPCLDIDQGRVVKGTNFVGLRDAGDPVELAKLYDQQHADELVFLDITASSDQRAIVRDLVERVAHQVFIPFTVGGGIRTVEDVREILLAGADKVSVNTAAVKTPSILTQGAQRFGSQCMVVAIDARRVIPGPVEDEPAVALSDCGLTKDSLYEVVTHGGRTRTGLDAVKWGAKAEALGAGEILLTSMNADGTQDGYDLDLTKAIKSVVNIPVIASGGAGSVQHIRDALGVCDAALLASLLHYGDLTVTEIKSFLEKSNIPIRN